MKTLLLISLLVLSVAAHAGEVGLTGTLMRDQDGNLSVSCINCPQFQFGATVQLDTKKLDQAVVAAWRAKAATDVFGPLVMVKGEVSGEGKAYLVESITADGTGE